LTSFLEAGQDASMLGERRRFERERKEKDLVKNDRPNQGH